MSDLNFYLLLVGAFFLGMLIFKTFQVFYNDWKTPKLEDDTYKLLYCPEHDEPWMWVGYDGTRICRYWADVITADIPDACPRVGED